ncbi:MAG: hypothetical protein JNL98_33895 [Bryobacterales bacterium]|nr:hypothetical protein [Bryobacterales bacterium]
MPEPAAATCGELHLVNDRTGLAGSGYLLAGNRTSLYRLDAAAWAWAWVLRLSPEGAGIQVPTRASNGDRLLAPSAGCTVRRPE